MQYHMPHEVEKKEEIFTPLDELTLSQHSKLGHRCDACKLGHIHPPLETSGQKIERPRSALSPNTVKPAEIWTPQKAFAVAEELSLSSIKRPKTAPLHRRNVPLLSPLGSNNDASSPTTPKNQTKRFNGTRPQSAFSRTGNNANNRNKSHRKNQTNSSNSNRRSNNNNNNNNKNERKIIKKNNIIKTTTIMQIIFLILIMKMMKKITEHQLNKLYHLDPMFIIFNIQIHQV